jgi:tetratricopeptide (TPR) repeat protein
MVRLAATSLLACALLIPAAAAEERSLETLRAEAEQAIERGDHQQAKKLFARSVALTGRLGVDELLHVKSLADLGRAQAKLGEFGEAEALTQRSLTLLRRLCGPQHPDCVPVADTLANIYASLGLTDKADALCGGALKIAAKHFAADDPRTLALHVTARRIWNADSEHGAADIEGTLGTLESLHGNRHSALIPCLLALSGDCYDRFDLNYAGRAAAIALESYGEAHPLYGEALTHLARAQLRQRAAEKAELTQRKALEVLQRSLGVGHPSLGDGLDSLARILHARGKTSEAEHVYREVLKYPFARLSDNELCQLLPALLRDPRVNVEYRAVTRDRLLLELARRGGPAIQDFLSKTLDERAKRSAQAAAEAGKILDDLEQDAKEEKDREVALDRWQTLRHETERNAENLELLTALRRAQRRPDPLAITFSQPPREECVYPDLPDLDVSLRNVDAEKVPVGFTDGGNYRSGRQARWRVEARDVTGRLQPMHHFTGYIIGGGIFSRSTLEFGEGWNTSLRMRSFVDSLPPGRYRIRVFYHDHSEIDDLPFAAGLILSASRPFTLSVKRRPVTVSTAQQAMACGVINLLDPKQVPKVVGGPYGKWAHTYLPPASPEGELLKLGWTAVPVLIESLRVGKLTSQRKAQVFALLFSITGENDPRGDVFSRSSALGTFEELQAGWAVFGSRDGQGRSGGIQLASGPSKREGKLSEREQQALTQRWLEWMKYLEVVPAR